jgi:hypothetical protein|tara:strand:- start:87 stop:1157 length:1071 start_codon:yes stop_codon:yes gene_type:complete
MSSLVYRLGKSNEQKRSNDIELGYYAAGTTAGQRDANKPMPYSRSLKRYHTVRYTDDNGKVRIRKIGYAPEEDTIYLDDFVNPNSALVKPKFKKGILIVDSVRQSLLVELLDKLNENENNPDRDPKASIVFHKIDRVKKAKGILEREEKVTKELAMFWDIGVTKKQALANWLGIRTHGRSLEEFSHDLYFFAKNNVKEFTEAYHNPDVEYLDYISRAENLSILKFNTHTWEYNEMKILVVSSNKNKYIGLVKHFINNPPLYTAMVNDVRSKEGFTKFEDLGDSGRDIDFSTIKGEEMLAIAIEDEIVVYKTGYGFEIVATEKIIGTPKVTLSKVKAAKVIDEDKLVFEQLKVQLLK